MQYAQDFDERYPKCYTAENGVGSAVRWFWRTTSPGQLYPYVKNTQVFICPSGNGDYGVNNVLMPAGGNPSPSLGQVQAPAETVALADSMMQGGDLATGMGGIRQGGSELRAITDANLVTAGPASLCNCRSLFARRHNEMANVTFADGHAKIMRNEATLTPNMWDLN